MTRVRGKYKSSKAKRRMEEAGEAKPEDPPKAKKVRVDAAQQPVDFAEMPKLDNEVAEEDESENGDDVHPSPLTAAVPGTTKQAKKAEPPKKQKIAAGGREDMAAYYERSDEEEEDGEEEAENGGVEQEEMDDEEDGAE